MVSNLGNFNPAQASNKVAALYLGAQMSDPPAPKRDDAARTFVTMDPAALQPFAGTYPLPKIDQTLEAVVDQGKLWDVLPDNTRLELKPLGPGHFYMTEIRADIEFTTRPDGEMSVKITQPGGVNVGDRIARPTPQELARYAGVYWSEE